MPSNHSHRKRAIPMAHFSKINTNYDEDEALPKPRTRWWKDANCKHVAVEDRSSIFFPTHMQRRKNHPLSEIYAEAAEFCKPCPVKTDCLEATMRENGRHQYGYQGGMNHKERRELHYARKRERLAKQQDSEGETK